MDTTEIKPNPENWPGNFATCILTALWQQESDRKAKAPLGKAFGKAFAAACRNGKR